jgi:hypothetical protein
VLAAAHAEAVRALEIRDPNQLVWATPRAELEATVAAYERVTATAPREVSAELKAERKAEADARARALGLRTRGQAELAAQAEARADAGNARATELEGAAGVYAAWQQSTAPQREAAELAQAELSRRGTDAKAKSSEPQPAVPPARASAQFSTGPEAEAHSSGPELEAPAAVAGGLDAAVDQRPELDASTVSPATEARLDELAARKAAQAEAAEDEAQREANREAYAAAELSAPEHGTPSAWVQGPATPEWGGPQASAPEPEAAELEAGL